MSAAKRPRTESLREKVIIDTDPGVDDFFALCLAFASPEQLEVLGLTIVAGGNGKDVDLLAKNGRLAAHLCGRDDVPVVKGACSCLTGEDTGSNGCDVHGPVNALGNVDLPEQAYGPGAPEEQQPVGSAARFLVERCAEAPREVTLITLGPLTNIADAIRLSPSFAGTVRRVVMMGGSFAGGGRWFEFGNRSPCAEANVYNDPEAAKLVFESFPDVVVAGLNVTHQLDMKLTRQRLLAEAGEAGRLCHAVSAHYVDFLGRNLGQAHIGLHDPTAVLAVLDPTLFESKHVYVAVETKGDLTRGQTVADWKGQWKRPAQTTVLMKVDAPRAHDMVVERISKLRFPSLGDLKRLE